ncbi:MAG: hypothetical protein V1809_03960 [Planctomycetota bacterium]
MPELEYIAIEEALQITGLSRKTLLEILRGQVPMVGHNGFLRREFFEFWRLRFEQKTAEKRRRAGVTSAVINALAKVRK